eukprot:COSAG02_NODE_2428_length_8885_cov_11.257796_5_plen_465_part_00
MLARAASQHLLQLLIQSTALHTLVADHAGSANHNIRYPRLHLTLNSSVLRYVIVLGRACCVLNSTGTSSILAAQDLISRWSRYSGTDSGKMPDTALPQLQMGSKGEPVDYASILSGTRSRIDYGTGSLLPFVGRPWSMNNWALQTNNYAGAIASPLSSWWYHPEDRELYGIRCTHQASPWIYDYGEFLITPAVGELKPQWPDKASKYNRTSAIMKTYQLNTTWQSYCSGPEHEGGCLSTALTATERAALLHIRFPPHNPESGWDQTRHLRVLVGRTGAALTDNVTIDMKAGTITGYTRANSGGVPSRVAPAGALAKQTHRAMSGLAQCPDITVRASFSLHFHLDGNLGPDTPMPTNSSDDLMTECAAICCSTAGCNAWRINLDSSTITCSVGKTATIKSGDDGTQTIVGWNADYTPVLLLIYEIWFRIYMHLTLLHGPHTYCWCWCGAGFLHYLVCSLLLHGVQ